MDIFKLIERLETLRDNISEWDHPIGAKDDLSDACKLLSLKNDALIIAYEYLKEDIQSEHRLIDVVGLIEVALGKEG